MFPIHINDGTQEMPTDDIFYIISKKGIFLKKKMGLMESTCQVEKISILDEIQPTAQLHVAKIPANKWAQIVGFHKEIYDTLSSESIVILFYNAKRKRYRLHIPFQKVTGAGINYESDISFKGYDRIGTIHSHPGSAFHSGTDDHDEESWDGLHITVGDLSTPHAISITASIMSNGTRFEIDPMDYIEGISMDLTNITTFKGSRYGIVSPLIVKKGWLGLVEKDKPVYTAPIWWTESGYISRTPNPSSGSKFNFDKLPGVQQPLYPTFDAADKDKKFKIPGSGGVAAHTDKNPCESCIYRNCKVELEYGDLDDYVWDDDETEEETSSEWPDNNSY